MPNWDQKYKDKLRHVLNISKYHQNQTHLSRVLLEQIPKQTYKLMERSSSKNMELDLFVQWHISYLPPRYVVPGFPDFPGRSFNRWAPGGERERI
jgi:hypothetical protein